jgi:hypothetical protein
LKHLLWLAVAVAAMVAAWLVFFSSRPGPQGPVPLVIPKVLNDQHALVRSAHQLWKATPGYYDSFECANFIKLLAENLDDQNWAAVSAAAYFAWANLRSITEVRSRLLQVDEVLVPRFARTGSVTEIEGLIQTSNARMFDRDLINRSLREVLSSPVPATGFSGSRHEDYIAAAIRLDDLDRAREYVAKVVWPKELGPEARAGLDRMVSVIDLCSKGRGGVFDLPQVVRLWQSYASDSTGRRSLRPVLENIGYKSIWEDSREARDRGLAMFSGSASEEGAQGYWERILQKSVSPLLSAGTNQINGLANILNEYGTRFRLPAYSCQYWLQVGKTQAKETPNDPLRAVLFFERACASADRDENRLSATKGIVDGCIKAYEFARAKTWVEDSLSRVKDPKIKLELTALFDQVAKKMAEDRARVAKQEKAIDLDLRRGRLQAMKDKLAAAKRSGRPSDELVAIERAIRELQREVTE